MTGLWTCGTLGKAHGLRGELYLNPAPCGPRYLSLGERFYLAAGQEDLAPCAVRRVGGTDQRPLLRLDLAHSREQAIALQGCELLAAGGLLDDLPHYRVGDLVGLRVETVSGCPLGSIDDVIQAPAHELLEIGTPNGRTLLVPLVDEIVAVDEDAGVARIVDGFLDDDAGV